MESPKLEIQRIKKINKGGDTLPSVCHDFRKLAPDDVLLEIFIRLPDVRSAVRSSAVCRSWHSLILGNPQFIPRFKSQHHQHQDRYPPPPCTVLFSIGRPQYCQLFSKEWMLLHGMSSAKYLDFLPSPMVIRASSNDLLLVTPGSIVTNDHYICNPITKQFAQLPPIPRVLELPADLDMQGYALVFMPPSATTNKNRFKVVKFNAPLDQYPFAQNRAPMTIFCSESRKWENVSFPCPRSRNNPNIVTCNGILYWIELQRASNVVVYLDLLNKQLGLIGFPPTDSRYLDHRLGAVRVSDGELELRLIQVSTICSPANIHLKVWRLNDGNNWVLGHNKLLKRPKNLREVRFRRDKEFTSHFVHPNDGDLVFTVWGRKVFECNLIDGTYKLMGEFSRTFLDNRCRIMPFPLFLPYGYGASSLEF